MKDGTENEDCTICRRNGHKHEGCFKLVGYPEWWPIKKGEKIKPMPVCTESDSSPIQGLTNEQYKLFVTHFFGTGENKGTGCITNMVGKRGVEVELIVDWGCTEHITHSPNILMHKNKFSSEPPVFIPNGVNIPVKGRSDCTPPRGLKVNGALCVPDFKCNLLSVSHLRKDLQCDVTFFPDFL